MSQITIRVRFRGCLLGLAAIAGGLLRSRGNSG